LVHDRRQAEGVYLVVCAALVLIFVLAQFLAWTWLEPVIAGDSTGSVAIRFFWTQVVSLVTLVALCAVGWVSPVRVTMGFQQLHLRRGKRTYTVSYEAIENYKLVSARSYHLDYRPYEDVISFVSRLTPQVVVLDTAGKQIALGLPAHDMQTLIQILDDRRSAIDTSVEEVPVAI